MIHIYSMNGINIAVDGNSGSIHVLDNIVYELMSQFNEPFSYEQAFEKLRGSYTSESIK